MPKHPLFVVAVDRALAMTAPVAVAFALARQAEGSVDLVEVVANQPRARSSGNADVRAESLSGSPLSSELEETIANARRHVAVRVRTIRGDANKVLPSYVQLTKATLLILDRHYGKSRWRPTAAVPGVSRAAAIPVLVVPPEFDVSKRPSLSFRHVLSPVNLTVASAVSLRVVVRLLRRSGARLTLVHALEHVPRRTIVFGAQGLRVAEDLQRQGAHIAQQLRRKVPTDVRLRVDARVTTGDPSRGILDIASDVDADLIVMGVSPRSRLDEVLFGSTLRRVLRRTNIPVLVLPVPAGAHNWMASADAADAADQASHPARTNR